MSFFKPITEKPPSLKVALEMGLEKYKKFLPYLERGRLPKKFYRFHDIGCESCALCSYFPPNDNLIHGGCWFCPIYSNMADESCNRNWVKMRDEIINKEDDSRSTSLSKGAATATRALIAEMQEALDKEIAKENETI